MAYQIQNNYKVTFKDGTSFESTGRAESKVVDLNIKSEFDWIAFHVEKEIKRAGKMISDVAKIEYAIVVE